MQYILTEEEMKIYKRCKKLIETDYKIFTQAEYKGKISDLTLERLKWGLGLREDFPKPKSV